MAPQSNGIRVVVINGSVRQGNYTGKAAALVVDEFKRYPQVHVKEILPAGMQLPLPGTDANSPATKQLQDEVRAATAIVLATPEYHGTFSSVMKLVIENLGFPSVLAGKPVALLGVAAGSIGAIKSLEHLRGVCSHIGAVVLPLAASIANVQKVFDADGRVHRLGEGGPLLGAVAGAMVGPVPVAVIVALVETVIALGLLSGRGLRFLLPIGIAYSLGVWATAEAFGGPYSAMGTGVRGNVIGNVIVYLVPFFFLSVGLYARLTETPARRVSSSASSPELSRRR